MNLIEAIRKVLESANEPLHKREITQRLLAEGYWKSSGKKPEDIVGSKLYTHILEKGDNSPFMKIKPGVFALRDLAPNLETQNNQLAHTSTPITASSTKGFSFTDCAQKVLDEFSNKRPMHYREITQKALENGWLITNGKTPEATMYAQILTETKRKQKRGEPARFILLGKGYVSLGQWTKRGLAFQIEQHNKDVRKALREKLIAMTPGEFEELISILLAEMGFENVEVTKLSGDGGIDVRGTLIIADVVRIKMAVQAKKWKLKNNVQAPVVQQVRGSLGIHEQGLIITTSDFSAGAVKEATQSNKTPIALMNGEQLVMLLMEYGIGVQRSTPDLFELDESSPLMKEKS